MIRLQTGRPSVPGSRLVAWLVLSLCLAAAAVVLRDLLSLGSLLRQPAECELDNEGAWSIGVFKGSSPLSLEPLERLRPRADVAGAWPVSNPVLTCASITDRPSSFVADPFLWLGDNPSGLGPWHMFYETKTVTTMQGDIGVAVSEDRGLTWKHLGIALDEPWHLSYPFLFRWEGQLYMMPEASKQGDLKLYRAVDFPLKWQVEKTVLHEPLIDASLVEYGGRWWMFASLAGVTRHCRGLAIYHADSPLGPWQPHSMNPVRDAPRCGGRPIVHDGQLIRFGQDCRLNYGYRLLALRVKTLNASHFEEVEVPSGLWESEKGVAEWNGMRTHHLDAHALDDGTWVAAIDGDNMFSGDLTRRFARRALQLAALCALLVTLSTFLLKIFGANEQRIRSAQAANLLPVKRPWSAGPSLTGTGGASEASPASHLPLLTHALHARTWPTAASPQHRAALLEARGRLRDARYKQQSGSSASRWCAPPWRAARHAAAAATALAGVILFLAASGMIAGYAVSGFGNNTQAVAVDGRYSKFTVMIMTYESRLRLAEMSVQHYSRCPSVGEVVIVWNAGKVPNMSDIDSAVPLRIRVEEHNSLNNRFKPDPLLRHRAVLSLDDDLLLRCADFERAFARWRRHPERIVSFYPRLYGAEGDQPPVTRKEKEAISRGEFNVALTGAAFVDADVLFPAYWSPAAAPARRLVDEQTNCEDILMNFVAGNLTLQRRGDEIGALADPRQTVDFIRASMRIDLGSMSKVGISHGGTFGAQRDRCLREFDVIFGGTPLPRIRINWDGKAAPICPSRLGCLFLDDAWVSLAEFG